MYRTYLANECTVKRRLSGARIYRDLQTARHCVIFWGNRGTQDRRCSSYAVVERQRVVRLTARVPRFVRRTIIGRRRRSTALRPPALMTFAPVHYMVATNLDNRHWAIFDYGPTDVLRSLLPGRRQHSVARDVLTKSGPTRPATISHICIPQLNTALWLSWSR